MMESENNDRKKRSKNSRSIIISLVLIAVVLQLVDILIRMQLSHELTYVIAGVIVLVMLGFSIFLFVRRSE